MGEEINEDKNNKQKAIMTTTKKYIFFYKERKVSLYVSVTILKERQR